MVVGKYIVFEGMSGTGKETQAKLLQQSLHKKGILSHIIYHPSPELKPIMQSWRKNRKADSTTIVYLLLADRHNVMTQRIIPALASGEWVISLRSSLSALVYQGSSDDQRKWIKHQFESFELQPDILVYFAIDPDEAMIRILKRHDETGESIGSFETVELLREMKLRYEEVLQKQKHNRVDASLSIEDISQRISSFIP